MNLYELSQQWQALYEAFYDYDKDDYDFDEFEDDLW